jgi:hypothetical protein
MELIAMTKKFPLSDFENRPDPPAIFSTILKDALLSWSVVMRSVVDEF